MQALRKKRLPTMTTARPALPTMTAKMRTTMMEITPLTIKVLGPGLIAVLGLIKVLHLMTMKTTMETTAAVGIKGDKQPSI
jgi:hypothetical protein